MTKNHFYEKKGPYPLNEIVKAIASDNKLSNKNNIEIHGLESLANATVNDITFLNSQKYKDFSLKTSFHNSINSSHFLIFPTWSSLIPIISRMLNPQAKAL